MKSVFAFWLYTVCSQHAAAFSPTRCCFTWLQHPKTNASKRSLSTSTDDVDPWEVLSSAPLPRQRQPSAASQQPIDTVAISSQEEKLKSSNFSAHPTPQTPQPVSNSTVTAVVSPLPSRWERADTPTAETVPFATSSGHRKVVFTNDGMMYQELLPKAAFKPKRLLSYRYVAFKSDGGMMFEARTASRSQATYILPEGKLSWAQQRHPSVFWTDGGMMYTDRRRTVLPDARKYELEPIPPVEKKPSLFVSDDGGMMFVARTAPRHGATYELKPSRKVAKRLSLFSSDGGMMFTARQKQAVAPQPRRPMVPIKGAFSPENGGMMYIVRQVQQSNPMPGRLVEYKKGVFSRDGGMMFVAKIQAQNKPETTRVVPYLAGVFSPDSGMMLVAKTKTAEAPITRRLIPHQSRIFSRDDKGMMFEAKQKTAPIPSPTRILLSHKESFGNDGGIIHHERRGNESRLLLSPKAVDVLEIRGQSFALFCSDGGIQMETQTIEKPVVKNPNPSRQLFLLPSTSDSMSFESRDEKKRLYLKPATAESVQTKGQSFAAFSSDGGIQLRTQMNQKPLAKNPAPVLYRRQLMSLVKDNMSFRLDDIAGKRRFCIPPKVAKASETIGQHFAAFVSDGGIQLRTRTIPERVGTYVVNPMDASFLHYRHDGATTADFDSDGLQYVQHTSQVRNRVYLPANVAKKVETIGQSFAAFESDGGIQKIASTDSTLFWAQ